MAGNEMYIRPGPAKQGAKSVLRSRSKWPMAMLIIHPK